MNVKDQVVEKLAKVPGARFWQDVNDCNCANGHCYHPWSKDTDSTKKRGGGHLQPIIGAGIDLMLFIMLLSALSHLMPNALDLPDQVQGTISHAAMMSKRAKVIEKLSAYDLDPMSLDACKKSNSWESPK